MNWTSSTDGIPVSARQRTPRIALWFVAFVICGGLAMYHYGRSLWHPRVVALTGGRTVAEAISEHGDDAVARLKPHFDRARVSYPPGRLALIALKEEKVLELWAWQDTWILVHRYPILAASGTAGPKLREGDRQVPEGFYSVSGLNPNSSFHLSIKLNYPNAFDRASARADGRVNLGGDIFIHGKAVSIGCIAIGDEAIEEVFCIVAGVDRSAVQVIVAPYDFRRRPARVGPDSPPWLPGLYEEIQTRLSQFTPAH